MRHSWGRVAIAAGLAIAGVPRADADYSVPALIRTLTNTFSEASDRADQAAMDALLDDEVLFSGGSGTVDRDPQKDQSDATSQLLKRQTQSFHDASQRGDLSVVRSYLDPQLQFVDEDGVQVGQRDFKTGAPAVPPGASSSKVSVTDWTLHHSGDVAVASYVNDQAAQVGSQVLHDRFLSVDIWIKRGSAWKLLGSETIPLNQDPAAIAVATQTLEQYVGTYSPDQSMRVKVARDGTGLTALSNAGAPSANALSAVAPDIFLRAGGAPGYGRALMVFRRDAQGTVSGYVTRDLTLSRLDGTADEGSSNAAPQHSTLVLRDFMVHVTADVAVATFFHDRTTDFGPKSMHATYRSMETWIKRADGWKMISSQGREVLPDMPTTKLPQEELKRYEGVYSAGAGLSVTLARDGEALVASMRGSPSVRLMPVTRDYFIVPGQSRLGVLFQRDAAGQITGYLSRRDGRDVSFVRS
jgi:ketosteroid isomerase-like protein